MKKQNRNSHGNISEFGPAFFVLFFILFFPVLNLLWVSCAYAVIALAANHYVSAAAVETSYDRALAALYTSAIQFNDSKWTVFGGLNPVSGYGNCGADLYLEATSIDSHNVETFGPNVSAPPPIDTSSKVWEFESVVNYQMNPLINMSSVPFIGQVPGVGRPCTLRYSAHKIVEHPDGLASLTNALGFSKQPNGSIVPAIPGGTGGGGVLPDDSSWYHPDIFQLIQSAGQTVLKEEVLIVSAQEANWVDTGIPINPGEKVWIDLRADGLWTYGPERSPVNADGYPELGTGGPWNLTKGMLIGQIGNNAAFEIGKYQLNMAPPGEGPLKLVMNDYDPQGVSRHYDNTGMQYVRIIVTK